MKIASFDVENLFVRAVDMSEKTWADGKAVLAEYA
jgi:hypothetical protein